MFHFGFFYSRYLNLKLGSEKSSKGLFSYFRFMREDVLQHIWRFGLFRQQTLRTHDGRSITIHKRGLWNSNAGPDFSNALIEIDGINWAGNVELHVRSTDWHAHKHSSDHAYKNVILHVVLEHNTREQPDDIPVLELNGLIHESFLANYEQLMHSREKIPCGSAIKRVPEEKLNWWLERVLIERLESKTDRIFQILDFNKGDWEETTFQLLARYFGAPLNADPFEQLARKVSIRTIMKERYSLSHIEALLFGGANLIPEKSETDYVHSMSKNAAHLLKKHAIRPMEDGLFKYFRVRPPGFPTIRMAQLAAFVCQSPAVFSLIVGRKTVKEWQKSFQFQVGPYWQKHYRFDDPEKERSPKRLKHIEQVLFINVIAPIAYAYGMQTGDQELKEYALRILEDLDAEKNNITRTFSAYGATAKNALQSQALIELKAKYCEKKRCLDCVIGNEITGK